MDLDRLKHSYSVAIKMQDIGKKLKLESSNNINIKATTEEKLGFTGQELGISSQSICLLI